jgi:predicted PurR-regulated permease PerM
LALSFQSFLISQLVLGLIMSLMLIPVLGILKVPFGLLLGLLIGLLEVIPLVGGVVGIGAAALVLAFQDIWLAVKVVLVSLVVQQIKDRFIAPRILGVIVAIPLTSVIKSLYELAKTADTMPALAPEEARVASHAEPDLGADHTTV